MSHIHDALRRAESEYLSHYPEQTHSPISSATILATLRNRAKLFSVVFAVCFFSASAYILLMPKKYEAEMKLLVKNERQDLVVSPESNVSTVHPNEISETQINSEIELLRSSDVLRRVAYQAGLSKPESGAVLASGEVSPVSLDRALRQLERDLNISAIKRSDIIDVTYTSKSPELAGKVLSSLRDNYLIAHLNVHANPGTFNFFEQQSKRYQERLAASEAQLRAFREKYSDLGLPDQSEILTNRSVEAQTALEDVDTQIADYKQRIAKGREAVSTLNPRVVTQTHTAPETQLLQSLTQTLVQLNNRRTELVLKFKPDDPFVKEVDKEISNTSEALEQARSKSVEDKASDINPIRQNTEKDMVGSQVALSGLLARRNVLATTVNNYKQKMFSLAAAGVQHETLVRQLKENEDNYLLYQKKREEARIAESLDHDRITNVAVIQAPITPIQPSSPRVKLDLALAFISALFVASTTVLLAEFLQAKPPTPLIVRKALTAGSSN